MDKQRFIENIEYLYHLTDRRNLPLIREKGSIMSTVTIIKLSGIEGGDDFLRNRRPQHYPAKVDGKTIHIRDQRPLNRALEKCLTDKWTPGDFIFHLNSRVFMWPNIRRLQIHYGRYQEENPVILRFNTGVLLKLNKHVEISRINSGATRPSGALGGKAATRGKDTFKKIEDCEYPLGQVAEVTFPVSCKLPVIFEIGDSPIGKWKAVST